MLAIKLNAGNDVNGNPRRVFVVLDEQGNIISSVDEGYAGTAQLRVKFPNVDIPSICTFDTSPKEYRELLRDFAAKK